MKTRTFLLVSVVINIGLAIAVGILNRDLRVAANQVLGGSTPCDRAVIGPAELSDEPHFGPLYETVLRAGPGDHPELMCLQTGRRMVQPDVEAFGGDANALISWIKATGLDLSSTRCEQDVFVTSYYMALVPCQTNQWNECKAADVLSSPELAKVRSPKRRCVFASAQPATFMFRTVDGAYGLLRIAWTNSATIIRYKLVEDAPVEAELALN